jgi:Galactose oxidase, central domain
VGFRRSQREREAAGGLERIEFLTAGVDVERGDTAFGPGVDGEVRLGDQEHSRHTLGRESVEHLADDGRAARDRGVAHRRGESFTIRQPIGRTPGEIEQHVESEVQAGGFFHARYARIVRADGSVGSTHHWSRKAHAVIASLWISMLACALLASEEPPPPDSSFALRLAAPRVNCTATITTGGRVLIAGGLSEQTNLGSGLADAELFDPAGNDGAGQIIGSLRFASRIFAARAFHDAVPLDAGRVLLIGGDLAGSLELFDPMLGVRGEFQPAGSLLHGPRFGLSATRLRDGRVFIVGGLFANQKPTKKTELFDPRTGVCVSGPDLSEPRHSHSAVLLDDGRVWIAGGVGKSSSDLFDPTSGRITPGPRLLAPRDDHRATVLLDGRVLVTAGQDAKARVQRSCEIVDIDGKGSVAIDSLRESRADHAQVLLPDGSVLVVGGEYDIGDDADRVLDSVERFDPRTNRFTPYGRLAIPRDDCVAIVLGDGRVAVIGGQTTGDRALASVEFLTPDAK